MIRTHSLQSLRWYKYFNNEKQPSKDVLLRDTTIYKNNLVVARKMDDGGWLFTKFQSLEHFITVFNNCKLEEKTLYATLRNPLRYLYLDVDYTLNTTLSHSIKNEIIKLIIASANEFCYLYGKKFGIKQKRAKWFVWDATRDDKFSIHLINVNEIMFVDDMKVLIGAFADSLTTNKIINKTCTIDDRIYHQNYQLWRLPNNHNGNVRSLLLLYNASITLKEQFEINFMSNIDQISLFNKIKQTPKSHKYFSQKMQSSTNNVINQNTTKTMHALYNIFNTEKIVSYKGAEMLMQAHNCPIALRVHKRNTARITIQKLDGHSDSLYYKFACMHPKCYQQKQFIYASLSNKLKRPWLYHDLQKLPNDVIEEIDLFIELLFIKDITYLKQQWEHYILTHKSKIRFNQNNNVFSTFFNSNVIHTVCGESTLTLSYKQPDHWMSDGGKATCYCITCKKYINLKNGKLIYS